MKFQNINIHGSKMAQKLQRVITQEEFFKIYSKFNQVVFSPLPVYSLGFKALALIAF